VSRQDIIRRYADHYNPTLALLFELAQCPIEGRSKGTRIYDEAGEEYLDFAAGYGVFSVGHANEQVQQAVLRQLETLPWTPKFVQHERQAELVELLGSLLPSDLRRVYLTGSGSEAIEIAIRTARLAHPRRKRLIAVSHGFHGKTVGAVGICGQRYLREPFGQTWEDVVFVPYGDAGAMARAIGDGAAAVFLEPVLGGGFVTVPPRGYLEEVRALCDRTDTLLVIDEVQTGFGRTGKMFAFQHDAIVPDVLILSKGMTGGHVSMAAAIVRDRWTSAISAVTERDPFAWASDSGASPIACAAAIAAIRFTIENRLPERAAELGPHLTAGLGRAAAEFPVLVLDAPGRGLMTGAKLRNNMLENAVWLQMLKRKVITGLSTNPMTPTPVMRFFPPLVVERAEIETAVEAFRDSLSELRRLPRLVLDAANQVAKVQYHVPKPILRGLARLLS
jgi:putrescine aminotransferase